MTANFDVSSVRKHFPALEQQQVFFDNAGGSQVLKEVIDSISDYLSKTNVQLGASYKVAQESTTLFNEGCEAIAKYINASSQEVCVGPSTTQLFRNLSAALYDYITPGNSEIIVSALDHEANIASWVQLASDRQCTLKWYIPQDRNNPQADPDAIRALMSNQTKLVAITSCSNILGTLNPIKAIARKVHEVPGALLCVDAVAFAPHRSIDVRDLGVDFYSFSWYKVYGPHIACLYASKNAQKHLRTLGHYFHPTDNLTGLLGLAAQNYELSASIASVCKYLSSVSWDEVSQYEEKLQKILIDYLLSKPDVFQIYGEPVADRKKRVPVISFTVSGRQSREIVEAIESKSNYGCRWGSFYSNRLVKDVLGLDDVDGVIRVSLLHYNTEEEVRGYIKVLNEIIS